MCEHRRALRETGRQVCRGQDFAQAVHLGEEVGEAGGREGPNPIPCEEVSAAARRALPPAFVETDRRETRMPPLRHDPRRRRGRAGVGRGGVGHGGRRGVEFDADIHCRTGGDRDGVRDDTGVGVGYGEPVVPGDQVRDPEEAVLVARRRIRGLRGRATVAGGRCGIGRRGIDRRQRDLGPRHGFASAKIEDAAGDMAVTRDGDHQVPRHSGRIGRHGGCLGRHRRQFAAEAGEPGPDAYVHPRIKVTEPEAAVVVGGRLLLAPPAAGFRDPGRHGRAGQENPGQRIRDRPLDDERSPFRVRSGLAENDPPLLKLGRGQPLSCPDE